MPEPWIIVAVAAVIAATFGLRLLTRRRVRPELPQVFADAREERLAGRIAQAVGCLPQQALPAVRREIELAPDQTDDTIFKRARYHYQMGLPEKSCGGYRDRSVG